MLISSALRVFLIPLLLPLPGLAQQKPTMTSATISPGKTLFVNVGCEQKQETQGPSTRAIRPRSG